jgi:hypothetical protein
MLRPDLRNSSSASISGKCDKAAISADRVPQGSPLAAVALTRPSSSSATVDRDAAREDDPSALSSTKPQTRAAEVRRASNSASASHRAASSAPTYLVASSRRARPDGGPRSRLQILMPGHSSLERHSSSFCYSTTSSSTTSTQKVSSGEHPSVNSTAEYTIVQSTVSSLAISVWQREVICIPSDK